MEPLRDITNRKRKVDLHVRVDEEYALTKMPYSKRGLDLTIASQYRLEGKKNIDLWVDGSLYSNDPVTTLNPPFSSTSSLLTFVGDGEQGLLGYCKHLGGNIHMHQYYQSMLFNTHQSLLQS